MPLSRRLSWAVPAVAAAAVASAVVVPSTLVSAGSPELPSRTAADLLASLAGSAETPLSGTVVQTARLGLPELPGGSAGTTPLAMLTGSHTLKVWSDGPERVRLALLGELAEYDAVRDGRDAWTYSSEQDEAVHYALPAGSEEPAATVTPPTPQDAAEQVLEAVDPTTAVRVDDTARVAGRDAYQLVVEPRDPGSLVGSVRLAVDADTSVPLRVQVWSVRDAAEPALEVGFTEVSFDRPEASVFDFVAPPDATVKDVVVPGGAPHDGARPARPSGAQPSGDSPAELSGTGWARVVELPGLDGAALQESDSGGLLSSLTTRVPEGRLLTTALLSALITDDGRLLVGSVPGDRLRESARG